MVISTIESDRERERNSTLNQLLCNTRKTVAIQTTKDEEEEGRKTDLSCLFGDVIVGELCVLHC